MAANKWLAVIYLLDCLQHVRAEPKVISMPTRRKEQPQQSLSNLERNLTSPLINQESLQMYEVDVMVGTPPQPITVDLDTGSSDIWFFAPTAYQSCSQLCQGGSFDPNKSTTYAVSDEVSFDLNYLDGSTISGNYFTDSLTLGSSVVTGQTMALASNVKYWNQKAPSIMGIGFENLESVAGRGQLYPGLTQIMVDEGLINARSYSLWLDDKNASTGTLMFGGYDTSKFSGNLTVLDILPDASGVVSSMTVSWTTLNFSNSTTSFPMTPDSFSSPALLDSGTSLIYVPPNLFDTLSIHFGTYIDNADYLTLVGCDMPEGELQFGFGGASATVVSIPFSELAIPAYDDGGNPVLLQDGSQACEFALYPSSHNQTIFGDPFLRSAYVVYALDAQQIGMAQSNFNPNSSAANIVEMPVGPNPFAALASSGASPVTIAVVATSDPGPLTGPVPAATSGALAGTDTASIDPTATVLAANGPKPSDIRATTSSSVAMARPTPPALSRVDMLLSLMFAFCIIGVLQIVGL